MSDDLGSRVIPEPADYGDRVRWATRGRSGEGVFVLDWFGVAQVWDVRLDDGTTVHLHHELGDTMQRVEVKR